MIIRNAKLYGQSRLVDLVMTNGIFEKISPASSERNEGEIDAQGKLVIPPYVEPHIHLDYALAAGTPRWNESGTLFEAIQLWSERKQVVHETKEDIKLRAKQALFMQIEHGVQHVRTHVDVTDPSLTGLHALLELREEMKLWVDVQLVAFPQEGMYGYRGGDALVEEAVKLGADVVGGIPHYEPTYEEGVASIKKAFDLAEKYDKLLDFHCDEVDDEQSRFVEVIAREADRRQMGGRVVASHTTAMGSYNDAYAYKLFQKLKRSGIHFVSLPKANLHLQGRFDTYPKRRGLTRVKELLEADMNVAFGLDSIQDPWYPLGNGNLMSVLDTGIHAAHLTGYNEIVRSLELITLNGAKALNLMQYGIEEGHSANLLIIDAEDEYEAVRKEAIVLYSIRNGEVIVKRKAPVVEFPQFNRMTYEKNGAERQAPSL
ncbi:cytosine deaminase [Geomicrobium sp. JCM 19055]|uniref:cytosine deaminase n=1 Tax=Geomicrobium sp. JCM 19055 TaxID=1460649 RepID=UPI00045EDBCC|nr:cytosine deaminase [Geomicrobium sp. JCM 19055]GAK01124.1 cytosine deaminase [Geomicrobium sp. JCM 19055]